MQHVAGTSKVQTEFIIRAMLLLLNKRFKAHYLHRHSKWTHAGPCQHDMYRVHIPTVRH